MPQGTVEVELVRGHDLKDVEAFGKSDPYAVLSCGHVTHRSRTIHDAGSNPVWNQTFLFEVPDGVADLAVAIYDLEAHGRDEAMGTALIPLDNVYTNCGIAPAKYKVLLRNGRKHGEVELGLKFFPKIYHGSLELHLVRGHNLFSADVFDKSDPYAVITCNKQTVKVIQWKMLGVIQFGIKPLPSQLTARSPRLPSSFSIVICSQQMIPLGMPRFLCKWFLSKVTSHRPIIRCLAVQGSRRAR